MTEMSPEWRYATFVPFTLISSLVALFGTMIILKYSKTKRDPLNKPKANLETNLPSVPSLPLVGPLYRMVWTDLETLLKSWIIEYGNTFRFKVLGKEVVILGNPIWIQKLLTSNNPGHMLKHKPIYNVVFPDIIGKGLTSSSNIDVWRFHRKTLGKAFTADSLKSQLTIFNQHANDFVKEIDENVETKTSLHAKLHEFTFYNMAEIIFGAQKMTREEVGNIHNSFFRLQEIMAYRLYHPWLIKEFIWKLHPKKKTFDNILQRTLSTCKSVASKAQEAPNDIKYIKSLIDYMIEAKFSEEEIYSEVGTFFAAGFDLVGIALEYFLYNVASYPEIQNKCRAEIDQIFLKHSCEEQEYVTIEALNEMKYVEMCVQESLRLYPPTPGVFRDLAEPLKLDDNLTIKKNTLVWILPLYIQRDPNLFPNPNQFNPDRFLPENIAKRNKYAYLPFLHGNRNCIGWKMSMNQIIVLGSYILRNFEVHTNTSFESLYKTDWWPPRDLNVFCTRRQTSKIIT